MKICLASSNPGKVIELTGALNDALPVEVIPQTQLNVADVEETGLTFVENALLKARNAALTADMPAIADDSGLVVDALGGAPGLYSARFAGPECDAKANIEKLLTALGPLPDAVRTARFYCVLVYLSHAKDPRPIIAEGVWEGRITLAPSGDSGFGYDPVFFVPSLNCTAAELTPEQKGQLSHRAKALQALKAEMQTLVVPKINALRNARD